MSTDKSPTSTTVFSLPPRLHAKGDPRLIARDEAHFAAIAASVETTIADLGTRLDATRREPGGSGQHAMERDLEIHRITARLRTLRRFGLDVCLGHVVSTDGSEPTYIGRLGLTDREGKRLLIDWQSPAAEPFFGATHANPMGVVSRRRYRWTRGHITDYWDEVFSFEGLEGRAALDEQSAFIASLGDTRSPRMRDVLATIQADQDVIIRAGSPGALVVDGGPGTGKTVVALHRAAYLLFSDPHLTNGGGGVLFVGPHEAYLAYIDDVLPSLGEENVQTCTLRDLVPEGASAAAEPDPAVNSLKSDAPLLEIVENAVRGYEQPPARGLTVETPWADLWLSPAEWAEAFGSADLGITHNEARDQVWEAILDILADQFGDDEVPVHQLRRALVQNESLASAFATAWPLLDPVGIIADLWSVPAYLTQCAPWLSAEEVELVQRPNPRAWTVADLPFLDAALRRAGDPHAAKRRRQREAAAQSAHEQMDRVVDELIAADDSELKLMSMLRGQDAQNSLFNEDALPPIDPDALAGPFAHIIVDEAQELSDTEWQMLLSRNPSRSFTIVGDRAQARHGFHESWQERLHRVGLDRVMLSSLRINYRTPEEVMAVAEPVIRAAIPDANVPMSIRRSGLPVRHGVVAELGSIVDDWLASNEEGVACVIGDPSFRARERVRSLSPEHSKGLEFDLVVLVAPDGFGTGVEGAVDRYVAMTRATKQLVILA